MTTPLLEVDKLVLDGVSAGVGTRLVDEVDLTVSDGEIVGVVGETGSGKSLTTLAVAGLLPRGVRVSSGSIRFQGRELSRLPPRRMRELRGPGIALVCQEPSTAFNPVLTVGQQVVRVLRRHARVSRRNARERAQDWLSALGIEPAVDCLDRYPHQLSGGMLQRVMLAMAASCRPRLLIADEPTAALDSINQSNLLDMLRGMSERLDMAVLLVSHDLGVVSELCGRVAVMRDGRVVEEAPTTKLLREPAHPYTTALLQALPVIDGAHPGATKT